MTSTSAVRPVLNRPAGRSGAIPLPSVGVEEEFLLLDPSTGRPLPSAGSVLDQAKASWPPVDSDRFQAEALRCQVETATSTCVSLEDLAEELRFARGQLHRAAAACGVVLAPVGAAPFEVPDQAITPTEGDLDLGSAAPTLLKDQVVNGMHVHVGVPHRAAAVEVLNRLRPHLHILLALGVNSPYWQGKDSGFASWRSVHAQRWPVDGAPPLFRGSIDYERRVETLLGTGVVMDRAMLYWQARLSERHPTVEIRVADVPLDVSTAVACAGLVRAFVAGALKDFDDGIPCPRTPAEVLRAASWQAAQSGLADTLVDLGSNGARSPRLRPASEVVLAIAERATDRLPRDERQPTLERVGALLAHGTGAELQRTAMASGGRMALLQLFDECVSG